MCSNLALDDFQTRQNLEMIVNVRKIVDELDIASLVNKATTTNDEKA